MVEEISIFGPLDAAVTRETAVERIPEPVDHVTEGGEPKKRGILAAADIAAKHGKCPRNTEDRQPIRSDPIREPRT